MANNCVFVTGGAGFIGSALVRALDKLGECEVVNIDALTYAGNLASVGGLSSRTQFFKLNICDTPAIGELFEKFQPKGIYHLAAESHVDRSIAGPKEFLRTNIEGTFSLLEATREYLKGKSQSEEFRFLHVSTDEVFGTLGAQGAFSETSPYQPNSPYSASKAASDHLVRAWYETYKIPAVVTNCSNNYGPYQYPEKLIPVVILNALKGNKIPVYGNGLNIRDWLYVEDHVSALMSAFKRGKVGETYNIGTRNERTTLQIAQSICAILDELKPTNSSYSHLISFVTDRPGHDFRYAIDPTKAERDLGWRAVESFESGLRKTVQWYLENLEWVSKVSGSVSTI